MSPKTAGSLAEDKPRNVPFMKLDFRFVSVGVVTVNSGLLLHESLLGLTETEANSVSVYSRL